jgi:hypothetical protein
VVAAFISLGTATSGSGGISTAGIPFTKRPDTISFDYKYTTPGVDSPYFVVILTKNYTDQVLGVGGQLSATNGQWVTITLPLAAYYQDANTPDTLQIQYAASYTQGGAGATSFCGNDSVRLSANTGTNYTYQWNVNGNVITGATSSSYVAKASGSYTVTIDSATATATSNAIVVVDSTCVGISSISAASLSVYPNPASSLLNINCSEP